MNTVSIIGTGRLGTSLAHALVKRGFLIRTLADKSLPAARQSRKIVGRGEATSGLRRAADRADLVFLCLPDEEIDPVVARLARNALDWRGKCVFHTSGIRSSDVLRPLKRRGARIASFHPIQSFPSKRTPPERFKDIYFGIEGDSQAQTIAKRIIARLGGKPLHVRSETKPVYHAACSMASNLFIPLFDLACELLHAAGISDKKVVDILWPLTEGSLQNVKHFNRETALTGPIARGDFRTVQQHLRALRKFPAALSAYKALGRRAVWLAGQKKIPAGKIKALKTLLEEK